MNFGMMSRFGFLIVWSNESYILSVICAEYVPIQVEAPASTLASSTFSASKFQGQSINVAFQTVTSSSSTTTTRRTTYSKPNTQIDTMPEFRRSKTGLILLGISSLVVPNCGFVPTQMRAPSPHLWQLKESEDGSYQGGDGVRLAQESAIKITGEVVHKPGKADAQPMELLRYTALNKVDESTVTSVLEQTGSKILCSGQGVEEYRDPGETTEKIVILAPTEAIKDAVSKAAPAMESESLVFNFLGGDDLMMGEVLDAAKEMVLMMDIATKAKISFNSLCHDSIPCGTCTVTVVSLGTGTFEGSSGVQKSIAAGEVYLRDGTYMTVQESEINTALA